MTFFMQNKLRENLLVLYNVKGIGQSVDHDANKNRTADFEVEISKGKIGNLSDSNNNMTSQ